MPGPTPPRHPHLSRLFDAIGAERAAVSRAHADALSRPHDEQRQLGVRWPPVRIESVVETWRGLEVVVRSAIDLHDGIDDGEPVFMEAGTERLAGRVLRADPRAAMIELRGESADLEEGSTVSVVRRLDPTTFDRLEAALVRADQLDSPLRTALLTGDFGTEPADGPVGPPSLDAAQAHALAVVLAEPPLAVVHGPPGTGKTWLLGHMLRATVDRSQRPWALAESNAAVDHLAATASGMGLDVVRLGHPSRVRADLQHLTVDARLARGPLAEAVRLLTRDLARSSGRDRTARAERRRLRRQLRDLRAQAWDHAVSTAQVVACTFGTLARVAERVPRGVVAFVDEATQATEPSTWVPVPYVDRMVLVGDPEQLGPVVQDPDNPLARSLLQRLVADAPDTARPPMLEVQHRMSAEVQRLVAPIYGPSYRPAPQVAQARLCDRAGVADTPLTRAAHLWVDTSGTGAEERRDPVTRSIANEGEARIVALVVAQLRAAGVPPSDIGVMAPYSAQVARLKRAPELEGVEVASVNAFQGRERPVMVQSWVRSGPDGTVGFVADPRRLTVAWSRARCLLVQVGDLATLSVLPRIVEGVDALGTSVVSAWEPPYAGVLGLA